MANTLKKSAASLKAIAAGEKGQEKEEGIISALVNAPASKTKQRGTTIMLGAHFDISARRVVALLQADPRNQGKQINDLAAEAWNDLCAKYGIPQIMKLARNS